MGIYNLPQMVASNQYFMVERYNFEPEPFDETKYWSYLGTPVFSPLEFLKVSGTSRDNSRGVGEAGGPGEVMLRIDTVLLTVNQPKNIVKTPIQGRAGTVKEYVSEGDFDINIQGAIVSPYLNVYPREDVELLIELLRLPKQIPVASDFLDLFSIDSIVIESFSIAQKLGTRNEVPFTIKALSDRAEELTLNPLDNL